MEVKKQGLNIFKEFREISLTKFYPAIHNRIRIMIFTKNYLIVSLEDVQLIRADTT